MVVLPGAVAHAALDLQLQQWSGRPCRGIKQLGPGSALHCPSRPHREELKWGKAPGQTWELHTGHQHQASQA